MATPLRADRLTSALMRVRGLSTDGTLGEFFTGGTGFLTLHRDRREFTAGIATKVWKLRPGGPRLMDASKWHQWREPGTVKAVGSFRAEPVDDPGCSLLVTETQVEAVDEEGRRKFRRYWLVVEPFSRLIRRRWLRAIAARAE
jgi:hypothetical protein